MRQSQTEKSKLASSYGFVFRSINCFNLFQLPTLKNTDYITADLHVFLGL